MRINRMSWCEVFVGMTINQGLIDRGYESCQILYMLPTSRILEWTSLTNREIALKIEISLEMSGIIKYYQAMLRYFQIP